MLYTIDDVIQYKKDLCAGRIRPITELLFEGPSHSFDSLFRAIGAAKDVRPLLKWMSDVKQAENHDDGGQCVLLNTDGEKEVYQNWCRVCCEILRGLGVWCSHCNTVLNREGFKVYVYHILQEDPEIDQNISAAFYSDQSSLLFNGDSESKWQDIRISIFYMSEMLEWVISNEDLFKENKSSDIERYLDRFKETFHTLKETFSSKFMPWANSFIELENLTSEEKKAILHSLEQDTHQYFIQKFDQTFSEERCPDVLLRLIHEFSTSEDTYSFLGYEKQFGDFIKTVDLVGS